jgi:ABC-2 type transport system permease protein
MSGLADRVAGGISVLAVSASMQISQTRASAQTVVFTFVQPAVLLVITILPLHHPSPARVSQTAVGVLLTAFWSATAWGSAGVLRRDRAQGTFARSLTAVSDPRLVVIGKGLGASLLAMVASLMTVAVMLAILRAPVAIARPGWLAVGLLSVVASGTAVGLLVGSVFVATRYGPQVSSALMYPVLLLGGMLVPISFLAPGVRWISDLISLRWQQQFLSDAGSGELRLGSLGLAVGLTAAYGVLGSLVFQRMLRRARKGADLDVF